MGVEYAHGIFVADLMWRPTWRHVDAISELLTSHGFAPQEPALYELAGEPEPLDERGDLPPNLFLAHDGLEGGPVRDLLGPSAYDDLSDEDRYIQWVGAVFGVDFKEVLAEGLDDAVIAAPREGDSAIEPDDREVGVGWQRVYPATWSATLPTLRRPGAIWRSGLVIDCGKDVPAIAKGGARLPARGFVEAIERALGTKVVELGWIY
jgi:hypothetical protein